MADPLQLPSSPFQFYRLTNAFDNWKPENRVSQVVRLVTHAPVIGTIIHVALCVFDTLISPFYFGLGHWNLPRFTRNAEKTIQALNERIQQLEDKKPASAEELQKSILDSKEFKNEIEKRVAAAVANALRPSQGGKEEEEPSPIRQSLNAIAAENLRPFQKLLDDTKKKIDLLTKQTQSLAQKKELEKINHERVADLKKLTEQLKTLERNLEILNIGVLRMESKITIGDSSFSESESGISINSQTIKKTQKEIERDLSHVSPIMAVKDEVDSFHIGNGDETSEDESIADTKTVSNGVANDQNKTIAPPNNPFLALFRRQSLGIPS